jgi:hypothetical protein
MLGVSGPEGAESLGRHGARLMPALRGLPGWLLSVRAKVLDVALPIALVWS